ncbi:MAG: MATE family efflux transporter, partial [Clostridia bacterium]|nr:MATE family efflux transporter [Clostridia bacterium]
QDRKLFIKMVIPVLIESVINTLFGIMDTAMLGRVDNASQAISAVGITGSLINMFIVLSAAFCVGFTAKISQNYGAHKYHECHAITAQMMPILAAVGVGITLIMSLGAPMLVRFVGANEEIYGDAVTYLRIIGYGMFFHIMAIAITSAFRGVGQTKLPMYYNIGAGITNVFFNYCLINGNFGFPALRVEGAAIATTISKLFMFLAAVFAIYRMDTIVKLKLKDSMRPKKETIMPAVKLGLSSALEQVILQGGNVLTTKIISVIETTPYAAYSVSLSMESMVWAISGSYGTVSTTLAGMGKV